MCVFLNTDGVVYSMSGFAASGGVTRKSKGKWILGYNRFLGKCSVAVAELESKLGGPKNSLIRRIQQILAFEEKWSLIYVPRETNRAADALEKMALLSDESLHMFEDPPLEITEILKDDSSFDNLSMIYTM
ncbi:hypothetical protein Godav_005412 [Gossypium davidsonii]|uniref:RNase H type-1 domain-containing protein n=2 Tax=Gossypium TaxID=3633 RepID=A0A7J8TFG4_GOSDV|nr:hypothetical protein [Gossypium davidsonii]